MDLGDTMSIKSKLRNKFSQISSSLSQSQIDRESTLAEVTDGMPELLRKVAAQGAVLLENDGTLPFASGTKLSLFGTTSSEWFYVGYGSGGDVNAPYQISLTDAVRSSDVLELNENLAGQYENWLKENPIDIGIWGRWILNNPEMPIDESIVNSAAQESDAAVITIGRSSGEDRDAEYKNGSYFLSDDEINILNLVTKKFDKVVVLLNVGSIMDMSWVKHYGDKISAIMYVWQGGMESGNAVCDLLSGEVNPCGKLTDTIAKHYNDYTSTLNFGGKKSNEYEEDIYVGYRYFETFEKDCVLYPFGYGLSYTSFDINNAKTSATDSGFEITADVTNTGNLNGAQVVQLYLEKPCGKLGNPKMSLVGFAKTKELVPNETEHIKINIELEQLASYDDCGSTNHSSSYVIEKGEYKLYLGDSVRNNKNIFTYYQEETEVYKELRQAAAPHEDFYVFHAEEIDGEVVLRQKRVAKQKYDLGVRITNYKPEDIAQTGNLGYKLQDVKDGKITMQQFVAQLGLGELEAITRGDYTMQSPLGTEGNAGTFGGVLQSLRDKGVPVVTTSDGPSGIRLKASCSLLPIGTLLACSFNTELVEELYTAVAKEMKEKGADVLLAPGMNIHRNPLCGRNFEYFSEDPFVTGKMAAACVKGIQSQGGSACPKHFACNNQEFRRTSCDSRLSERALREIYLKGFEICIKEAQPKNIMTSYNKINGVWGHYNYDLCTTILRGEWGYKGNVMTDWWIRKSKSPEFPNLRDQAYRVRAQVDLFMPGGDRITNHKPDGTLLKTYGLPDGITLGEMQRCAMNVLTAVMNIKL
jgi:beta-glucosidase